jgi:hypothetical protein
LAVISHDALSRLTMYAGAHKASPVMKRPGDGRITWGLAAGGRQSRILVPLLVFPTTPARSIERPLVSWMASVADSFDSQTQKSLRKSRETSAHAVIFCLIHFHWKNLDLLTLNDHNQRAGRWVMVVSEV